MKIKSQTLRYSMVSLCGLLLGLLFCFVFLSIAAPAYDHYLIPLPLVEKVAAMESLAEFTTKYNFVLLTLMAGIAGMLWLLMATRINPAFADFRIWRLPRPIYAFFALLASGLLTMNVALEFSNIHAMQTTSLDIYALRAIAIFGVCYGCAWLLLSEHGFGQLLPAQAKTGWREKLACFFWGAGFSLLSYGAMVFLLGYVLNLHFILMVEVFSKAMEPVGSGIAMIVTAFLLLSGTLWLFLYSMVPWFTPGERRRQLRNAVTAPALVSLAVAGLLAGMAIPAVNSVYDIDKPDLLHAAGLQHYTAQPYYEFWLCGNANCYEGRDKITAPSIVVKPRPGMVSSNFMYYTSDIPIDTALISPLKQFISGTGANSVHRKTAIQALSDIYNTLWMPYEEFHVVDDLETSGELPYGRSILTIHKHLAWLGKAAAITDRNRASLEALSDTSKYYIQGHIAQVLAGLWRRFGDAERARNFMTMADTTSEAPPYFSKSFLNLEQPQLSSGNITGTLDFTGVAGARIALVRWPEGSLADGKIKADYAISSIKIVDSQILDDSGNFQFTHLTEGDYSLIWMLPATAHFDTAAFSGSNIPGLLSLSRDKPKQDLGRIGITVTQKEQPATPS